MAPPTKSRRPSFVGALLLIALAGLTLRAAFVVTVTQKPDPGFYDAAYYKTSALLLTEGYGFSTIWHDTGRPPMREAAAEHPPLMTFLIAPVVAVWGTSDFAIGLEMALLGTVNIVLIGVFAARLRSPRCGLIAAGIAALYPFLWVNDGLVMSETVAVTVVVLCLMATYRLLDRWRTRDAVVLGALCGVAALTRGELVFLLPLLIVGVLVQRAGPARLRRLALSGFAVLVSVAVVTPWVTYNLVRFPETVLISTNFDIALSGAACDAAFYGPGTGYGTICPVYDPGGDLAKTYVHFLSLNALQRNRARRDMAIEYIGDHLSRYPVVVLARAGRTWSVFRPFDILKFNELEGRPRWVTILGLVWYYPLMILAVWGAFVLRRRRHLWPLLVPPIIVMLVAFIAIGLPRFRAIAEPVIVVLAAVAVDHAVRRRAPDAEAPPDGDADEGGAQERSGSEAGRAAEVG